MIYLYGKVNYPKALRSLHINGIGRLLNNDSSIETIAPRRTKWNKILCIINRLLNHFRRQCTYFLISKFRSIVLFDLIWDICIWDCRIAYYVTLAFIYGENCIQGEKNRFVFCFFFFNKNKRTHKKRESEKRNKTHIHTSPDCNICFL